MKQIYLLVNHNGLTSSMKIFENIISDRGSKYAVSGRLVTTRDEIVATIKLLKKNKKFAKDIFNSLDDQGIWHLEQSYSGYMLENNSYDTICHEHLEYYSITVLKNIFRHCDLTYSGRVFGYVQCEIKHTLSIRSL